MPGIEIQKIMTGISISERTERGKNESIHP